MFSIQVQGLIISPRYWCGEVSHPSIEILLMIRKGKYIMDKLAQGSKGSFQFTRWNQQCLRHV